MIPLVTFLTPEAGKWIIIRKFRKEIDAILYDPENGDPGKNPSSLKILGWPYNKGTIDLQWTEFVANEETAKNATLRDGITKKYTSYRSFLDSNFIIGTRKEEVEYLNKIENHPAVVEVTASDGGSVEIVIMISFEIINPILVKKVEDFLGYGSAFIIEAFRLWAAQKTFKEIRSIDTDNVKAAIFEKIESLNQKEFDGKGFRVPHVAVIDIPVAERSKDLLESEESIIKEKNAATRADFTLEMENKLTDAQAKRNTVEVAFQRGLADIRIDERTKTADAVAKQNAAWAHDTKLTHLFISGGQSPIKEAVLEASIQANDYSYEKADNRRQRESSSEKQKKGGDK